MGLKQMVAKAMQDTPEAKPPVHISGDALKAYATKAREWSGIPNARLIFGDPSQYGSPWAAFNHLEKTFILNADRMILNPNRVLLTVTPFRMKQEAVLTGALLHETGHARHTKWVPRTKEQAELPEFKHRDGETPTEQAWALARLTEEARIEGLIAGEAEAIGAKGLDWTMRAAAAHNLPMTSLSDVDPDQQIMDLISSWALRAGRQRALAHRTSYTCPPWVYQFDALLIRTIEEYLDNKEDDDPSENACDVMDLLTDMVCAGTHADTGPFMIDMAREILNILFPETEGGEGEGDGQSDAMPNMGCASQGPSDDTDESDDEDEQGGDPQSGGSDAGDGDESDDEDDEEESDESDTDGGSGDKGDEDDAASDDSPLDDFANQLADLEQIADDSNDEEVEEAALAADTGGSLAGGSGPADGETKGDWRMPTAEERDIQRNAERFLRDLIAPSETSKMSLSESPAATVDGAALAAWKAGGQVRAPQFFKRTRRTIEDTPPIKIAVLVDVSFSMETLQAPSAVLSWALSCAALDLQNFAGRGQHIESTLIHWGDSAHVKVGVGEMVPGISTVPCIDGTQAMADAMALVEEQIPDFFEPSDANRLLIQFTDWELSSHGGQASIEWCQRALKAGVNMVTVAPEAYNRYNRSWLPRVTEGLVGQRGVSSLMKYNPMFPEQVWAHTTEVMA